MLAWTLLALLALVGSAGYHLRLDLAGIVAVEMITGLLGDAIRGSLEVGRIEQVAFGGVTARSVVFRDPDGNEVINVARVTARPNLDALWTGTIFIDRVRVRGGVVTLRTSGTEDSPSVSIADTFMPMDPSQGPSDPSPLRVVISGIVVDDILVRGDVPGYRGLRVENVRLEGRVEVHGDALIDVYDGRGEMTGPYPGRSSLDRIVGHVNSDLTEGLDFFARGHRGNDHFRARFRLWRDRAEAPIEMDLRATFDPIRMETLAQMELAPGLENLSGTFRGTGRLNGPVGDLRLRGDVTSAAGRVHVRGQFPSEGPIALDAWTHDRLRLEELVPAAPAIRVGARAHLELETDDAGVQTRRLRAETRPFRMDEIAIPELTIDGLLQDEELRVTELTTQVAGGDTRASGRVGYDLGVDLHVRSRIPEISREPNVHRFAPGARGALDADVDVRTDPNLQNPRLDGRVTLRGARYGSLRAASLDARGHLSGTPPAPTLRVAGAASGLSVGELTLGEATVSVRGGPGGYELHARSADGRTRTRVTLDGRATSHGDRLTLQTRTLSVDLGDGDPWAGELDLTMRTGRSVELDPLRLTRGDESLVVRGTYRFRGPDDFDVTARNVDLDQLERLAPETLAGLDGTIDAHLVVSGDVDTHPQGELTATIRDGQLRGLQQIDGGVRLRLAGETLETDVRLDLGDSGELRASGPVQLNMRDPSRLVDEADLGALRVEAHDLDIGELLLAAGSDAGLVGRITTDIQLDGTVASPGIRDAVVILEHISLDGWDPLRAKLRLSYAGDRLTVNHIWIADVGGELASGRADLPLSLSDPPTDLRSLWRQLNASTWNARLEVVQRRLDTWPRPARGWMPPGIEVAGRVDARGDASGPHANYEAIARVVDVGASDQCSVELEPYAQLHGTLEAGLAGATIEGFMGSDTPALRATVLARLPLDQWVTEGGVGAFPATEMSARIEGAEMSEIPYLCDYGRGPISGNVTLKNLLTDGAVASTVIDLPRLQVWQRGRERGDAHLSDAFRVHLRAGSAPERDMLTACLILGLSGTHGTPGPECRSVAAAREGELISRVRVPFHWVAGQLAPVYTEGGRLTSWSHFSHVHVAPVLHFVPGIVAGDVVMRGHVQTAGDLHEMRVDGALDLSEGHVQIEGLGQHLHDISGRVELRGDRVVFPRTQPLQAADSGGTVSMHGQVTLESLIPSRVSLSASARGFPVRREGMVLAWLSGAASIEGTITEDLTDTVITTRDFDVRLPEQSAASLQPLQPHPDLLVVGSQRAQRGASLDAYEVVVRIAASDPFWVRRNDFAVQVTADLRAVYRDPQLFIGGSARIRRGTFEIFGKRFELTEGSIVFEETSSDLDPQVRVIAIYDVPGRRGATVTVEVTGSLTHPQVAFRSTETSDPAEIIGLIVAGGRHQAGDTSQAAAEQAASFLAGLTAGILTLGLRQEFGDVIPVLAIESQGLGGTRIRAGFTADDLIPDFLRDVIVGAYVEGFVTAAAEGTNAAGTSSGSGGVGGGVTIEFAFPDDLLLRGTWVPVDNGSLDLVYEP